MVDLGRAIAVKVFAYSLTGLILTNNVLSVCDYDNECSAQKR